MLVLHNKPLFGGVYFLPHNMVSSATLLNYFRQRDRGWVLSLLAAVGLVYLPFLGSPFVFDDLPFFSGNSASQFAGSPLQFNLRWLPYASMGWTWAFFIEAPHFYRLGNALLHASNVILLFYLLRQLVGAVIEDNEKSSVATWGAWFGALVFACHPVAVYAVGYVIQRSILLATLFALAMQLAYVRGLLTGHKRWLVLAVVAYFMAVFSKEHSVLMPAVLAAFTILLRKGNGTDNSTGDLSPGGLPQREATFSEASLTKDRHSTFGEAVGHPAASPLPGIRAQNKLDRRALFLTWGAFAGVGILAVLRSKGVFGIPYEPMAAHLFEQHGMLSPQGLTENAPMLHLLSALTQTGLFFKYLLLWCLPNPAWMSVDMRESFVTNWSAWQGWLGVCGFILYGVLGCKLLLSGRWLGLAGLALLYPWLLFGVELSSTRVQEPFVLYRSYLWMPGMMLFFPLLLANFNTNFWFRSLNKESITLAGAHPAREKNFAGMTCSYSANGNNFPRCRTLLALGCVVLLLVPLAWNRLWVFADNYRLWNDAVLLLRDEQVAGADRIFYNRGNAALAAHKLDEAIVDLQRTVAISPLLAPVRNSLGIAYFNSGRYKDAIKQFDAAIAIHQDDARAYYGKGMSLKRLHADEQAMQQMKKSCELKNMMACVIVAGAKNN